MFVNRNQPFKNLHLSTSVSVSSYTLWKKTMHNNLSYHIFLDYITEFSKKQYTITLEPKHIRSAISTKLLTENSAFKKRSSIFPSAKKKLEKKEALVDATC
jgi:hypothetical protein